MKNLYLFLNKHMKSIAVIWAACLIPVAIVPAFGWVVVATIVTLCAIIFVGDYPKNWIAEVEIPDCPGY